MYRDRVYLEDRRTRLRDAITRGVGEALPALVCRTCYSPFDYRGCLCDRKDWVPAAVALAELELQLDQAPSPAA